MPGLLNCFVCVCVWLTLSVCVNATVHSCLFHLTKFLESSRASLSCAGSIESGTKFSMTSLSVLPDEVPRDFQGFI